MTASAFSQNPTHVMGASANNIDQLDRKIILELQKDARKPYKNIAQKLKVAEGTVRNRVSRLVDKGILVLQARVNPFAFQHKISALVGVRIEGREPEKTLENMEKISCVTAIWNATGRYDLFFELMVDSLQELNDILFREVLGKIRGVSYTETFITLSSKTKYYKLT